MAQFFLNTGDVPAWAHGYDGSPFHAILSDFPYDLGFMGRAWDTNAQFQQWGAALLPLLLPGSPALVFGGTRTWHRLAVGLEDAGFEIWDTLMWLYGTGFPKAMDMSKLIDKELGLERKVVGRRPESKISHKWRQTEGRKDIPTSILDITEPTEESAPWAQHKTTKLKPAWEPILCLKKPLESTYAQTALSFGSGALDMGTTRIGEKQTTPTNVVFNADAHNDLGTMGRYFYCTKSSQSERHSGLPEGVKNDHPTLKPVSLTTYVAKLLLPPRTISPRRILVPFSGSGSEVIGCLLAGWDEVVGIELDPAFNEIARHRCNAALRGEYDQFI